MLLSRVLDVNSSLSAGVLEDRNHVGVICSRVQAIISNKQKSRWGTQRFPTGRFLDPPEAFLKERSLGLQFKWQPPRLDTSSGTFCVILCAIPGSQLLLLFVNFCKHLYWLIRVFWQFLMRSYFPQGSPTLAFPQQRIVFWVIACHARLASATDGTST